MSVVLRAVLSVSLIAGAFAPGLASAEEITGAGSTFVYPILSKWSVEYNGKTGNRINYQSIGSGGGIAQIKASTVDFGATDMPLTSAQLQEFGLGQFPSIISGVVPVVNIRGIQSGQLRFTGPLLADIYLGKVNRWDDPAIKALNPELALPAVAIYVVHRSDGSGTTFNWVNYLSKVSPEWKSRIGEGTAVPWPTGVGGKGNEGVAAYVGRLKNSIGYLEYAYVLQNNITYGLIQNRAGVFVKPDESSFQAAAASADWKNAKDFYLVMTDAPGEKAYPVTATTFILMYKHPKEPARSKVALDFFQWAFENGGAQAQKLDYVPLPDDLVAQIERYWKVEFGR